MLPHYLCCEEKAASCISASGATANHPTPLNRLPGCLHVPSHVVAANVLRSYREMLFESAGNLVTRGQRGSSGVCPLAKRCPAPSPRPTTGKVECAVMRLQPIPGSPFTHRICMAWGACAPAWEAEAAALGGELAPPWHWQVDHQVVDHQTVDHFYGPPASAMQKTTIAAASGYKHQSRCLPGRQPPTPCFELSCSVCLACLPVLLVSACSA